VNDVYAYIDAHAGEYLAQLQRLLAVPSIAATGEGMADTTALVRDMLDGAGAKSQVVPTGGQPVVYGVLPGKSRRTLSFYNHYDVQPPEPLDEWHSPPFQPTVRDGRLFARGVSDNKGNFVARLAAIDALRHVRGELPLTLKFIVEGEEEIGSPNLGNFADAHPDLIAADGCIWEAGGKDPRDRLGLSLGVKGILYVELRARGPNVDVHSAWGGILTNPAWRLTWALSSLKGPDERIMVAGFYDAVREPGPADLELLAAEDLDERAELKQLGLESFLGGLTGMDLKRRLTFSPTCTICGIGGGYQGPGLKTVLAARASAKVDFRLVPDQDPEQVEVLVRRHLKEKGFGDIELQRLGAQHPARTDPRHPLVGAVSRAARAVYGHDPMISPMSAGSGPMYVLSQRFGIATVSTGVGNFASNAHAPNENIFVADFVQGIKHIAAIIDEFAAARL